MFLKQWDEDSVKISPVTDHLNFLNYRDTNVIVALFYSPFQRNFPVFLSMISVGATLYPEGGTASQKIEKFVAFYSQNFLAAH